MPIPKVCEVCGRAFAVRPYRAKTARFCSSACGGRWHLTTFRQMRGPSLVGNRLRAGCRPTNAFVSEAVRGANNPRWVAPRALTCEQCGVEFTKKPWQLMKGGGRFCSRSCFHASGIFRAERSPCWVGGPRTYRGRGWLKARAEAAARDGGTCQDCGRIIGPSIPVHHVRPFREFATAAEANALANLVSLCQPCHMGAEKRAA